MTKPKLTFLLLFFFIFPLFSLQSSDNQARMASHLLSYLARDYSGAVSEGKIISETEYKEQIEFVKTACNALSELSETRNNLQLQKECRELSLLIENKQSALEVEKKAKAIQSSLINLAHLEQTPATPPNLANGKILYTQNCAQCHGPEGNGKGPLSKNLTPPPANFTDEERMKDANPFQFFNTIRLGVDSTSMRAFTELNDEQVWDLAYYVNSFRKFESNSPLQLAQNLLTNIQKNYSSEKAKDFQEIALKAYLEGVEPEEHKLRSLDAQLILQIEQSMGELRTSIQKQDPTEKVLLKIGEIQGQITHAENLLNQQKEHSSRFAFAMAFGILLREGFEALILILTLLGVVKLFNSKKAAMAIHLGWISALALGGLSWFLIGWAFSVSGADREVLEGATSLFAVLMLLYVGFWLHRQAEIGRWTRFLKEKIHTALESKKVIGLAFISFIAVFREVIETVLFLKALWLEGASAQKTALLLGVGAAFFVIFALAYIALRWSVKLPLQKFFAISSFIMAVLAFILTGKGLRALQSAGVLNITPLPSIFQLSPLGIYPSLQTLFPQILLLGILILVWFFSKKSTNPKTS